MGIIAALPARKLDPLFGGVIDLQVVFQTKPEIDATRRYPCRAITPLIKEKIQFPKPY